MCFVDAAAAASLGGLCRASGDAPGLRGCACCHCHHRPWPTAAAGASLPAVLPGCPLGAAGPYLCTQGAHGRLPLFMAETRQAVDLTGRLG